MSEPSVAEAWSFWSFYDGGDTAVDAARDLALAGFRAGWKVSTGRDIDHAESDYGAIEDPGCMCSYHVAHRRIEELGR